MEFVGFQIVFSLTAVIICLIFLMAFGMKKELPNVKKFPKQESHQKSLPQISKKKSIPTQPLSILDPHQPNYMKRQSNYS